MSMLLLVNVHGKSHTIQSYKCFLIHRPADQMWWKLPFNGSAVSYVTSEKSNVYVQPRARYKLLTLDSFTKNFKRFLEISSWPVDIDPDQLDDDEGIDTILKNHSASGQKLVSSSGIL